MNIGIIQVAFKFITMIIVSFSSLFMSSQVSEEKISINNVDRAKSSGIVHKILKPGIIYKYSEKIPEGIINVVAEGIDGVAYLNDYTKEYKTIKEAQDRILEIGTGRVGEYTGIITAYGPDCDTCDGRGYVYCPDINGNWVNLHDSIYYKDIRYGEIRILAADHREFPCGTIVEVKNSEFPSSFIGIVLDTGIAMRRAYDNGVIHLDLAFSSESETLTSTNYNTSYNVKRWGW